MTYRSWKFDELRRLREPLEVTTGTLSQRCSGGPNTPTPGLEYGPLTSGPGFTDAQAWLRHRTVYSFVSGLISTTRTIGRDPILHLEDVRRVSRAWLIVNITPLSMELCPEAVGISIPKHRTSFVKESRRRCRSSST